MTNLLLWFDQIKKQDVSFVGGKNASLGEMYQILKPLGVNIPNGFATTSESFWHFLRFNKIDEKIKHILKNFNPDNLASLKKAGHDCRALILKSSFPPDLEKEIKTAYQKLSQSYNLKNASVAVRSSATAEDLPSASFAGQHETYLNVRGEKELLAAIKKCFSSLFTDRAIAYREEKKFDHTKIALSAGILKMVRSDKASSGVMFTLDTESGFRDVILINSIYGIGEMIVKGRITPDEFFVFKPTLEKGFPSIILKNLGRKQRKYIFGKKSGLKEEMVGLKEQNKFSLDDEEILQLAKWGCQIEKHYGIAQDIEWAKDGETKELFIVQSRPETVHQTDKRLVFREYVIKDKVSPILTGIAVGNKIGQGEVNIINEVSKSNAFQKGQVLVTKMTDPDWVPIMRMASAIVTDEGGKTAHAAIVSRELGVPCIVGSKNATRFLKQKQMVTVDCSSGSLGKIYNGKLDFEIKEYDLNHLPDLGGVKIMVNVGDPQAAFSSSFLPQSGVGLAREEFIIAEKIRVHPLALYHFEKIKNQSLNIKDHKKKSELVRIVKKIEEITIEHKNKKDFFIKELAEGVGQISAAFWPKPVILRFSDFKTNEYSQLIGGSLFEPKEENPMLGWRGASRYYDPKFLPAFLMEIEAIKRVRDEFGLKNLKLMVPFCRTIEEGKKVLEILSNAGLERGKDDLQIYVMCEIPSNVVLADKFLEIFDGMSIGSNDLTQLLIGLDRDNGGLSAIADERDEAVKIMIKKIIRLCKLKNKYCGICGQAPSDYPEFAEFLIKEGIESISLNPDAVIKTLFQLGAK